MWAKGLYQGVSDGEVVVLSGTGERTVPLDAIREMRVVRRVRVPRGSHWVDGPFAIGAVIDLVLVAVVADSTTPSQSHNDDHQPERLSARLRLATSRRRRKPYW